MTQVVGAAGAAGASPVPAGRGESSGPAATWRVSGGIAVDVDDLYALSATCRTAAVALDTITGRVTGACLRGQAALGLLATTRAPGQRWAAADPAGAVRAGVVAATDAGVVADASRRLPGAAVALAGLGLRVALSADRYVAAEADTTASMGTALRELGTTVGYLDRLAGRKSPEDRFAESGAESGAEPGAVPGADADSLPEILAGPLAALYPGRTAEFGAPTDLGPVPPPDGIAGLVDLVTGTTQGTTQGTTSGTTSGVTGAGAGGGAGGGAEPPPGRVDVTAVTSTDAQGRPRTAYVVALPGTTDWSLPGSPPGTEPRNLHANLQLMAGLSTAELEALPAALAAAGVPAGATLAFVGHSQGGMTAYAAASAPGIRERYRVTHVLTAGSPVGAIKAPPHGVRTLSLENTDDVVPALDGRGNLDAERRLTVTFTGAPGEGPHDLAQYVAAGVRVDADPDPRLTDYRESLREGGFLAEPRGGGTARTTRVDLRLTPPG